MAKVNVLQALAEIPLLVGEVEYLQTEVAADQVVITPGVSASISGVKGKLALVFTPASFVADAASTTEGSSVKSSK